MLPRAVYSLQQKILEKGCLGSPVSRVLMFHEVYRDAPQFPTMAVSADRFNRLLEAIPSEMLGTPDQVGEQGKLILTFDDIFSSAFEYAVPCLREKKIPFTVFIAPKLLDQPGYLKTEHLRELVQEPLCTVAAHSMNHQLMRFLPEKEAAYELGESKRWLEDFCGREIRFFAFPYGSIYACSKENIRQVKEAGFQLGFSTVNRGITAKDLKNPWFLPRINMNDFVLDKRGI